MKNDLRKTFALCVGVLSMSLLIAYITSAWIEPTLSPTNGSINAPLNTGSVIQSKAGGLNIGGNVGIGTTGPTQKLDVNGYVKGRSGLCIGDNCCDNWTDCVALGGGSCKAVGQACASGSECCTNLCSNNTCANPSSCKAVGQACAGNGECCTSSCVGGTCASSSGGPSCKTTDQVCTTNTDCCSSSCAGGTCQPDPLVVNCNSANLGAGIKKIFVTGPYIATDIGTDAKANDFCSSVGGGRYKALVYVGGELPSAKLPASNEFWNCAQVSTGSNQCVCNRVARHKLDLFTDKGGGSYLLSPIIGTESGTKMSGVRVWTNFRPDGTGGTIQLDSSTFGSTGGCYPSGYQPCYFSGYSSNSCYSYWCQGCNSSGGCGVRCHSVQTWYGLTSATDMQWSYVNDATNMLNNTNCLGYSRAIYCVQQ